MSHGTTNGECLECRAAWSVVSEAAGAFRTPAASETIEATLEAVVPALKVWLQR